MNLCLVFDTANVPGACARTATAAIALDARQFESFFKLRELAEAKAMKYVEIYIHGVAWQQPGVPLETGDFIVNKERGIALKSFAPQAQIPILSNWIDWETLSQLNVKEDQHVL